MREKDANENRQDDAKANEESHLTAGQPRANIPRMTFCRHHGRREKHEQDDQDDDQLGCTKGNRPPN